MTACYLGCLSCRSRQHTTMPLHVLFCYVKECKKSGDGHVYHKPFCKGKGKGNCIACAALQLPGCNHHEKLARILFCQPYARYTPVIFILASASNGHLLHRYNLYSLAVPISSMLPCSDIAFMTSITAIACNTYHPLFYSSHTIAIAACWC